jgi:hypothetical protein
MRAARSHARKVGSGFAADARVVVGASEERTRGQPWYRKYTPPPSSSLSDMCRRSSSRARVAHQRALRLPHPAGHSGLIHVVYLRDGFEIEPADETHPKDQERAIVDRFDRFRDRRSKSIPVVGVEKANYASPDNRVTRRGVRAGSAIAPACAEGSAGISAPAAGTITANRMQPGSAAL